MANFLNHNQIFSKHYCFYIFIILLCFSYVQSSFLHQKMKLKKPKDKWSKLIASERDLLKLIKDSFSKNHLEKMNDASSLHVITSAKVHTKLKNNIITFYATILPVLIFGDTSAFPKCDLIKCFKIQHIIGIYSEINDINLNNWKNMFYNQWNPRARIIIWLTKFASSDNIKNLLNLFWQYECMNVVVIVNTNSIKYKIYSYNPFIINNSGERGLLYLLSNETEFFPNKIENVYGHNIRVSIYHRPPYSFLDNYIKLRNGTEVELIKSMSTKFNFTTVLITSNIDSSDYVIKLENGINQGPIGDLLINKSDMLGNSFYINSVIDKRVEYVLPFFISDYVAIVPKTDGLAIFIFFYYHITNPFCLLILISMVILAIYLYFKKERYPVLATCQLLLFQNFTKFTNNYFDKYLRFTWILWATIISSLYQGVLYTYLSTNTESNINTLEELNNSGLKLQVSEFMVSPLNSSRTEYNKKLGEKATVMIKLRDCYKEFQDNRDVSCGCDRYIGRYYFRKQLISENPAAHVVAEPLGRFWNTFIVKDGFPFLKQFAHTVKQCIESGLFQKWGYDNWVACRLVTVKKVRQVKPLKMSYFKSSFLILLFGCTIASLIFILEYSINFVKAKYRASNFKPITILS